MYILVNVEFDFVIGIIGICIDVFKKLDGSILKYKVVLISRLVVILNFENFIKIVLV